MKPQWRPSKPLYPPSVVERSVSSVRLRIFRSQVDDRELRARHAVPLHCQAGNRSRGAQHGVPACTPPHAVPAWTPPRGGARPTRQVHADSDVPARRLVDCPGNEFPIDSEMSGSKATWRTLSACCAGILAGIPPPSGRAGAPTRHVARNGATARREACATSPGRSESFLWDSLLLSRRSS